MLLQLDPDIVKLVLSDTSIIALKQLSASSHVTWFIYGMRVLITEGFVLHFSGTKHTCCGFGYNKPDVPHLEHQVCVHLHETRSTFCFVYINQIVNIYNYFSVRMSLSSIFGSYFLILCGRLRMSVFCRLIVEFVVVSQLLVSTDLAWWKDDPILQGQKLEII